MGLGPGGGEGMTLRARHALEQAEVILGYKTYLKLAGPLIQGKETEASGMTKELDRAGRALDLALSGRVAALISSGDPGIYAMAAVVFELIKDRSLQLGRHGLQVEVVPGVPAVSGAASILGAPLSHDFACISLSDRLTPWELIEKRLDLAARADFVIALYNPKSKSRTRQYPRALEIISRHRGGDTPVGVVTRVGREGEACQVLSLAQAQNAEVDMQTVVIIGNSQSFVHSGRMVTPRGYLDKYGHQG